MSTIERRSHRWQAAAAGAVLVLAALLVSGCAGGPDPEVVEAGRKDFVGTCATCHGEDGRGKPKLGKDLHANEFTRGLSDEELVEFLKKGRPAWDPLNERGVDMPPRGGNPALSDADLAEIVAYLRTLQ